MGFLLIQFFFLFFCLCGNVKTQNGNESKQFYTIHTSIKQLQPILEEYGDHMEILSSRKLTNDLREYHLLATSSILESQSIKFHIQHRRKLVDISKDLMKIQEVDKQCQMEHSNFESFISSTSFLKYNSFFNCFWKSNHFQSFLNKIISVHSQYITKFQISTTLKGQPIYGYRIGLTKNSQISKPKPFVYIQGLLHAREWLSPPTVVYAMASLIDDIQANKEDIVKLLKKMDYVFVPLVNIDGYDYTWEYQPLESFHLNSRLWRKNLRNDYGVDLNRNWGPQQFFCTSGTSKNTTKDNYCGEYPYSEPEAAGIHEWLSLHKKEIIGLIDVHAYGKDILYPYGYTKDKLPPKELEKMINITKPMEKIINSVHNGTFDAYQSGDLYPASGAFDDYGYLIYHRPALTIELRGGDENLLNGWGGFVPESNLIKISGSEIYPGITLFGKLSLKYYPLEHDHC